MPEPLEIDPRSARQRLGMSPPAILIDVREPQEVALASVAGARVIPMNNVPAELQSIEALADGADLLVLCHHGVRSLQVAAWLRNQGIDNCYSVAGGIDRWSIEVDPSVPRY